MSNWDWKMWLVFSAPFDLLILGLLALVLLQGTFRTRIRMAKQLKADPDMVEWLVVFDWSRKALYIPTILASLIASGLMSLQSHGYFKTMDPGLVGGVWLAVFFVNFLIDEYEINLKFLIITILLVVALMLWLDRLNWMMPFLHSFRHLGIQINSAGYLLLASVFTMAVVISWIKGLFYYVAITPNYMGIQSGPTETGEQVSREDYNTRIDTGDFLERLLGFGRIIITFHDPRRAPVSLLVCGIGRKAKKLESIRGILTVERGDHRKDDNNGGTDDVTKA